MSDTIQITVGTTVTHNKTGRTRTVVAAPARRGRRWRRLWDNRIHLRDDDSGRTYSVSSAKLIYSYTWEGWDPRGENCSHCKGKGYIIRVVDISKRQPGRFHQQSYNQHCPYCNGEGGEIKRGMHVEVVEP